MGSKYCRMIVPGKKPFKRMQNREGFVISINQEVFHHYVVLKYFLKTEVQNCAFFGDLSTATTKYLRLWRPASLFKIHSEGCKSNGEAL